MAKDKSFYGIPIPKDSAMLRFLYRTIPGRMILRLLTARGISRFCGRFMDSPASRILISSFIEKNGIDLSEYQNETYHCFNDCFARRIRPENRPMDMEQLHLMSPCDGLLSVYRIQNGLVIPIKQSRYSIADLLCNAELASRYDGGLCLVFRLCVNHYHRYHYMDSGVKGENIFIPGVLHTVRPIALRESPVFTENCREYTVIETENFGSVVQMEVGAMLVGKICNRMGAGSVQRGEEKGNFAYGGSTIVLLLEKNRAELAEELFCATEQEMEVPVQMGQKIGAAIVS